MTSSKAIVWWMIRYEFCGDPTESDPIISLHYSAGNIQVKQRVNGELWNYLGSYSFPANAAQAVTLSASPSGVVVADAVKFLPVNPAISYIHADHLNTPRVITSTSTSANNVLWRWDSDPFGVGFPNEDVDGNGVKFTYNLRFPGQYYDSETNNFYNYFRDYDPSLGRYAQSDPRGLGGGPNTYIYVADNPISFDDPSGLEDPFDSPISRGIGGLLDRFLPGESARSERGSRLTPCYLYYLFDCNGEIVYVGITNDMSRREGEHQRSDIAKKFGCPQCPLQLVYSGSSFASRADCRNAEIAEIQRLRPIFNSQDNPDPPPIRDAKRQKWRKDNCMDCDR